MTAPSVTMASIIYHGILLVQGIELVQVTLFVTIMPCTYHNLPLAAKLTCLSVGRRRDHAAVLSLVTAP
jgi:hypothetical protein